MQFQYKIKLKCVPSIYSKSPTLIPKVYFCKLKSGQILSHIYKSTTNTWILVYFIHNVYLEKINDLYSFFLLFILKRNLNMILLFLHNFINFFHLIYFILNLDFILNYFVCLFCFLTQFCTLFCTIFNVMFVNINTFLNIFFFTFLNIDFFYLHIDF